MAKTTVFLEGFVVSCHIGAPKGERMVRQGVRLDISCELGAVPIRRDALGETLNYASIHRDVRRLVAEREFVLLETLAEAVALICFADRRVLAVTVQARKPEKLPDCAFVGVSRTFDRSEVM